MNLALSEWISNVSCYSPLLLDDIDALDNDSVSIVDLTKASVMFLATLVTVLSNLASCKLFSIFPI